MSWMLSQTHETPESEIKNFVIYRDNNSQSIRISLCWFLKLHFPQGNASNSLHFRRSLNLVVLNPLCINTQVSCLPSALEEDTISTPQGCLLYKNLWKVVQNKEQLVPHSQDAQRCKTSLEKFPPNNYLQCS